MATLPPSHERTRGSNTFNDPRGQESIRRAHQRVIYDAKMLAETCIGNRPQLMDGATIAICGPAVCRNLRRLVPEDSGRLEGIKEAVRSTLTNADFVGILTFRGSATAVANAVASRAVVAMSASSYLHVATSDAKRQSACLPEGPGSWEGPPLAALRT